MNILRLSSLADREPASVESEPNSDILSTAGTRSNVRVSDGLGVGSGISRSGVEDINIGSTEIQPEAISATSPAGKIYWNYLDAEWAGETQMTLAVFTTPAASVGGRSLNPLSEVDEAEFVTDEGAKYLEESGIRETTGLGPNLSWTVPPAEVASQPIVFLGDETPMRTYVGYAKTGDSEIPRTLLINLATTETGDDIAFGVTVQHRAMYSLSETTATAPTDAMLSELSVPDVVGIDLTGNINYSAGDDITLILEAGLTDSADLAAEALGDLSLA